MGGNTAVPMRVMAEWGPGVSFSRAEFKDVLCRVAVRGYKGYGRGLVVVEGRRVMYLPWSYVGGDFGSVEVRRLVESYSPADSMVVAGVVGDDDDGFVGYSLVRFSEASAWGMSSLDVVA